MTKKILGLALAGAFLVACGGGAKQSTGMQNTTANSQGDSMGGGSSTGGTGQGNMAGSSTGPTGNGGNNAEQQSSGNSSPSNP
jgi:hypothetical protein